MADQQSNYPFMEKGFTQWVRIRLSPSLLYAAYHFASLSQQIERQGDSEDQSAREQHRGLVIGGILASVNFLEAAINELYSEPGSFSGNQRLGIELEDRLRAMWAVESFRRGARALEKYQVAFQLAGKQPFPKGQQPYQDAKLLIDLRNALVHFVPTWSPIQGQAGTEMPVDEFGKQLRGKFTENPWKPKFGLISRGAEPEVAEWPFFPEACLGSGCAYWAANTGLNFADRFFETLGIEWLYEHLRRILPSDEPRLETTSGPQA